jgi:hypothetical protein
MADDIKKIEPRGNDGGGRIEEGTLKRGGLNNSRTAKEVGRLLPPPCQRAALPASIS